MMKNSPLIIQSDGTFLLFVEHPLHEEIRDELSSFAELIKSPEHIHTYRITNISLWNAASSGRKYRDILEFLNKYSKYSVPQNIARVIKDTMKKYGIFFLSGTPSETVLCAGEGYKSLLERVISNKDISPLVSAGHDRIMVNPYKRGILKQRLIELGYPVEDKAGYIDGDPLPVRLKYGPGFSLRPYQKEAAEIFFGKNNTGQSGVICLPCGSGKTIVGLRIMELLSTKTLILVANIIAARQWINELIQKSHVNPEDIGEFSGERKEIKPVTIATYQILTYRKDRNSPFVHFDLFSRQNWGLIIYDEVHLLPAPVFQITALVQAKRRLGLTATLVREDGKEKDVFSLIGPKKYDVPWKTLEKIKFIARAVCYEIRIELPEDLNLDYLTATRRQAFRIASENPEKLKFISRLLEKYKSSRIIIIGQYINQLNKIQKIFNIPLIKGSTPNSERERIYNDFRNGRFNILILSKVGNVAVDIPDANVLIQVSGSFGSRQEEAQRLGRILRPKDENALFFSLVSKGTHEQEFAMNRQIFLAEQGYSYQIIDGIQFL